MNSLNLQVENTIDMQFSTYTAPEVEVIMLQPGQNLLVLSDYGDSGQAGGGFGGDNITDIPDFEIENLF